MMLQSSTIRQRKAPPPGIYDPAGNILSKTVAGKTTTYTYDKANQLVSSKNADGKVTKYEYDAAGRMVKEGEKTFAYGWLDKVMQVAENGKTTQSYSYDISGQLATADYGDSKETFLWDGLALLSRNNLKYVNEPAVTGGNPILAGDKMLFDDMLGNTLGVKDGEKFSAIDRDAFGELKPGEKPNLAVNFFTGKPEIDGLGYSFLFRNYRADLGKWQTIDPAGYPDGWNNLAYCNNGFTTSVDPLGLEIEFKITGASNYNDTSNGVNVTGETGGRLYRLKVTTNCSPSSSGWSSSITVSVSANGTVYTRDSNGNEWKQDVSGTGSTSITFTSGLDGINSSSSNGYDITLSHKGGQKSTGFSTTLTLNVSGITWNSKPNADKYIYGTMKVALGVSDANIAAGGKDKNSEFTNKGQTIFSISVRKPE